MEDLLIELDPVSKKLQAQSVAEMVAESHKLAEQREFADARDLLRQALQMDASNHQARSLLEKVNAELKRILVRPKAQQLVDQGRALLQEGNIQEAKLAAENALHLDSSFDPAQELNRVIRQELDRAQLIAGWLQSAKEKMAEGLPDEADLLVGKVLQAEPDNEQAIHIQQQVTQEKADRQRRLHLLEQLQQARGLWTDQKFVESIKLLTDLALEFPNEEEISRLLETVREDYSEHQKQQALLDARNLLAAGRYEDCISRLTELQKKYPQEPEILRILEDARRDLLNQRRLQGLAEVKSVLARGQHDQCLSLLSALQKEFPTEPEIPKLFEIVREDQAEQRRRQGVAEARKLLAARQFAESSTFLSNLEKQFPGNDEILKLQGAVRDELAEQHKKQGLSEARKLLAAKQYDALFALLASLQKEFPAEDEIPKLEKLAREEQAEQRKRDGLARARTLLASGRHADSIVVLTELQAAFPRDNAITKLLENARADQAEQQKQHQLAEARARLAAQSFDEATALLENLLRTHPKDQAVLKLRALVQREQEKHARAQRVQRELDALKKLMSEKKYSDVTSRTKDLLLEFPGETAFTKLADFAGTQQAQIEKERLLAETVAKVRAMFDSARYEETMAAAQEGLKAFPKNPDLLQLAQQAEVQQRKQEIRQHIEQRVREIRVKINREKFSEAIDLAKQTLVTFGPDTGLSQLLNSAEIEFEAREKKRQQERTFATIRTLIEAGNFDEANQTIDQALDTQIVETFDPRLQRLSEQLTKAKSKATDSPVSHLSSATPGFSKEYAFLQAPPTAPEPTVKAVPQDSAIEQISAPQAPPVPSVPPSKTFEPAPASVPPPAPPVPSVTKASPKPPPPPVTKVSPEPPPPQIVKPPKPPVAQPSVEKVFVAPVPPSPPVKATHREKPPAPQPAPVTTSRRPAAIFGLVAVVVLAASAGWYFTRSKPVQPVAPTPQAKTQPAGPVVDPLEVQQRHELTAAEKMIAENDLENALKTLQQASTLRGPLSSDIQKKLSDVQESMKDAHLRQLRQGEEVAWQQAMTSVEQKRYTEAQKDLRQILSMPAGGVRKDDAQALS